MTNKAFPRIEDQSSYRDVVSKCKEALEDSKNEICQISSSNISALLERIEKEEKERERQERNVLTGKSLLEMLEQVLPNFDKEWVNMRTSRFSLFLLIILNYEKTLRKLKD